MKHILSPICILVAGIAAAAEPPKVLGDHLRADAYVKGEVVVVVPPPELDKYVAKVEEAARRNPEWFREHSQKGKPGVPLPYDEKLGLTKEEYEDYLKLWSKREFKPVEAVILQLKANKENLWAIQVAGSAHAISMLKYDPKEDKFRSPNGTLDRLEDVDADPDSTLGAWTGHEWKFEESTSLGTTKENIAIGKTGDKKFGLIVYRLQEVSSQGTRLIDRGMVIRFPLGEAGIIKEKPAGR